MVDCSDPCHFPSLSFAIKVEAFIFSLLDYLSFFSSLSSPSSIFVLAEYIDLFGADGSGWEEKVIIGDPELQWGLKNKLPS
jgi:hypothetical protein